MSNSTERQNARNQGTESALQDSAAAETKAKEKKAKQPSNVRMLLTMTSISLVVMIVAVVMIFLFVRSNPDLVHTNDQTTQISENQGFVNPDSIQKLVFDDDHITMEALPGSEIVVACALFFMAVMVIAYLFIKFKERKEDE